MNDFWRKESRILRSKDFRRIQRKGKKWKSGDLLFLYLPNQENKIRIGLVVSKKVGNAVVRNKTKRWLREIFRKNIHQYQNGVDIVVIAFSSFVFRSFEQIEKQCHRSILEIARKQR